MMGILPLCKSIYNMMTDIEPTVNDEEIDTTIERWATLDNLSKYEISTFGRIRNIKPDNFGNYKYLSPNPIKKSLKLIRDDGTNWHIVIHKLIGIAFVENPDPINFTTIIFKNKDDPNINRADNLRWASKAEQNQLKPKCITNPASGRKIICIDPSNNYPNQYFDTMTKGAEWIRNNTNFGNSSIDTIITGITTVCSGVRQTSYGFNWVYDDNNEEHLINTEWKDIPPDIVDGTEGYMISRNGEIKDKNGRLSKPTQPNNGYYPCYIAGKTYKLHRLLAFVFKENDDPINNTMINHIDGNKLNNCLDNLEWVSNSKNVKHAYDNGLNPNARKISCENTENNETLLFNSIVQAAEELKKFKPKITVGIIGLRLKNHTPYENFTFKYV